MKSTSNIFQTLEKLRNAQALFNVTKRMYSPASASIRFPYYPRIDAEIDNAEIAEKKFKKLFDPIAEELQGHRALNHPLWALLEGQSQEGFNPVQFKIYRDNFFFRTELTIPSVARVIEKAALNGDLKTVAEMVRNLYDEGGYGDENKIHSKLLLDSHNKHGERVFEVEPLDALRNVQYSDCLVQAVYDYRESKIAVFDQPYPYIAGNTWTHELAADGMLVHFREAFFEPYKGYYSAEEYDELIGFYKAHKDDSVENGDVEAQHERMARAAVQRACRDNIENIPKMREGAIEFLDRQAALWDDIEKAIVEARGKGDPIPPKPEFDKPKTTISPLESKQVSSPTINQL